MTSHSKPTQLLISLPQKLQAPVELLIELLKYTQKQNIDILNNTSRSQGRNANHAAF